MVLDRARHAVPAGVRLVDAHTHLMPRRLAEAIRAFFDRNMVAPLAYPLDQGRMLDLLHADGVDEIWNLPYAHRAGIARRLNGDMAAITGFWAEHPIEIATGATTHPDDDDPADEIRRAVELHGARICKLHCSVGDYSADDPRLDAALDTCGDLGVPVTIHAGHAPSGSTAADELTPIARAAGRHPGTTIVIAHLGHHAVDAALDVLDEHPNVIGDLTPVVADPVPVDARILERYPGRLMFGSDAPNTGCTVGDLVERLVGLGVSSAILRDVLSGTADRLTGGSRT